MRARTTLLRLFAAIALFAAVLVPVRSQAETIGIADYRARLDEIERSLAGRDVEAAAALAAMLSSNAIESGDQRFAPDASVLDAVRQLRSNPKETARVRQRLATLIGALDENVPRSATPPSNGALLDELRRREELAAIEKRGRVIDAPTLKLDVWTRIEESVRRFFDRIAEWLDKFFHWLHDLWPRAEEKKDVSSTTPTVVLITIVFVLGILALAAVRVLRSSKRATKVVEAEAAPLESTRRDDDPLSRESREWETYAAKLASEGRIREAMRAWYHAVLVALYRTGALHYRKGRTNWEYLSTIPAGVTWRGRFALLTREFDREWYGRGQPTHESLGSYASEARAVLQALRTTRESA